MGYKDRQSQIFADDELAEESVDVDKLSFVHWLALHHVRGDEFFPLAHLVLSGGPDDVWAKKPVITPKNVADDIEVFYATGRKGVTYEHVELAGKAKKAYRSDDTTVSRLVQGRRQAEDMTYEQANRYVFDRTNEGYENEGLARNVNDIGSLGGIEPVMDENGNDITPRRVPGLVVRHRCTYINDRTGHKCDRNALAGNDLCSMHGGKVYTDSELRSIHHVTKQKLLGAAEQAVDTTIELLDAPNDMVRLKAAELILDRTGFVAGMEISVISTQSGNRSPSDVLVERIERLAANQQQSQPASDADDQQPRQQPNARSFTIDIIDAEVVDSEDE